MKRLGVLAAVAAFFVVSGIGARAQEGLVVLSYNVCWQCMSPGRRGLGGQCRDTSVMDNGVARSVTSCSEAMGAAIDGYAPRYDFVGLQESSHWRDFRFLAPKTLGQMQAIESRSGSELMVVFYDSARFTHQFESMNGDIGRGRPIMVNLFSDQAGGRYTFVNLHNCHGGCSLTRLEQAIDDTVRKVDDISDSHYGEITDFIAGSRIVVTGDFNEASYRQTGNSTVSWRPFHDAGVDTAASVADAPKSCCSTRIPWRCGSSGTLEPWCRPGDYVFDSGSVALPVIPGGYDDGVAQSDHKPVIAFLP